MNYVPQINRRSFVISAAAFGGGLALGMDLPLGPKMVRAASELNEQAMRVDGDRIALLHQRDGAADIGFRCDVPDDHAPGPSGKAAIGNEADALSQSLADQRRRRRKHFAHAGTALGAFVPNHHHIARLDLLGHDGVERGRLRIATQPSGARLPFRIARWPCGYIGLLQGRMTC